VPPAKATSVTHEHLLSVVNTEAARFSPGTLRVLDVGCGHGELLAYLVSNLPLLRPSLQLECYGFDVSDSGMMPVNFLRKVVDDLCQVDGTVDWAQRISLIRSTDPWPYGDDYFDVIVSNQVIEHVDDHELFFRELRRTLKDGGYSVHLVPLRECVWEPHIKLPLFHRLRNHDARTSYIGLMVRLRVKRPWLVHPAETVEAYSGREADIMRDFTNYVGQRDLYNLGKKVKLRTSFRYTRDFYYQKLRSLAHLPPRFLYRERRRYLFDFLSVLLLRYVAPVTLFLEKRRGIPHDAVVVDREAAKPATEVA